MKAIKYAEIVTIQLFIVIMEIQRGIGVLTIARGVSDIAAGDGWISVIAGGMAANIIIVFLVLLASRFPEKTIFEYTRDILGRLLGNFINLLYIVYFMVVVLVVFTHYAFVMNIWVYPNTPYTVFKVILLIPAVYIVRNGLKPLVRYTVLIFYITGWLLVLFAYPLIRMNPLYLQPVGNAGIQKILLGGLETTLALLGFEIILVLYPFVQERKHVLKAVIGANIVTTFSYTVITLSSLGFFSQDYVGQLLWPMLTFFRILRVFGVFERTDVVFLSVWILTITTTMSLYLYGCGVGISITAGREGWFKNSVPVVAAVLLAVSLFIKDVNGIFFLGKVVSYFGGVMAVGIPVLLLLIAVIFKKKDRGVKLEG